jgi:hypothetical protein
VVIRVCRQTAGEIDASAIEELAAGRDGDEHRRVTVLGNADGRRVASRNPPASLRALDHPLKSTPLAFQTGRHRHMAVAVSCTSR